METSKNKTPRVEAAVGETIWMSNVFISHGCEMHVYCESLTVTEATVPVVQGKRGAPRMLYAHEATFRTEAEARQYVVRELCVYRDKLAERVAEELRLASRAEIEYAQVP